MRRLISLFLILLILFQASVAEEAPGTRLIALNIGKADCLLLLFDDQAYLIDGGWEQTYGTLHEALQRYGITRLNGVFLTHCDRDHYGGLLRLASNDIPVDAWYAASIYHDIPSSGHPLVDAAAVRSESVRWLNAGDVLELGSTGTLTVLGPLTKNIENENNNSLVFSVETADGFLLFTGDMKLEEEAELLTAGLISGADVLKVPFHGDNTASSESFVQAVMPQIALICTSTREEPDTPAGSVLKRYQRIGAQVYVTQDFSCGIEITLKNGVPSVSDIVWQLPDYSANVRAVIDLKDDMLTLRNSSASDISISGWAVYSSRGSECIFLPEGAVLPANGVYKIGTRATSQQVDLSLDMKRMWHKSKLDQAMIYDEHGSIAAVTSNGMPE